jgi:hypothetical protein
MPRFVTLYGVAVVCAKPGAAAAVEQCCVDESPCHRTNRINPIFSSGFRDQHTIMASLGLAATTDTPMRSAAALALEVLPRSATAKVEAALTELGQTLPQKGKCG